MPPGVPPGPTPRRAYHHGDLRRALLDAAVAVVAEQGPGAVRLRDLARRAGVSHAAPAHHFGDRAGLLTAVAVEGFGLLAEALEHAAATEDFAEVGVAYVLFADGHPGHFPVMFRSDLLRPADPDLVTARARTTTALRDGARRRFGTADRVRALTAWSLVHGLATLVRDGAITPGPDADLEDLARAVTHALTTPPAD